MNPHTFTCIKCPLSCQVELLEEDGDITVKGHTCPQGEQYALDEFTNPVRILTTTVCVDNGTHPVLPVRSGEPIPKHLIIQCMKVLSTTTVQAPVKCGDPVHKNILDTGVDIIASRDMPEKQ
jgi:CxxC motif-containing protein